jgi:hypothetical protein
VECGVLETHPARVVRALVRRQRGRVDHAAVAVHTVPPAGRPGPAADVVRADAIPQGHPDGASHVIDTRVEPSRLELYGTPGLGRYCPSPATSPTRILSPRIWRYTAPHVVASYIWAAIPQGGTWSTHVASRGFTAPVTAQQGLPHFAILVAPKLAY